MAIKFTKQGNKVIAFRTDAKRKLELQTQSVKHYQEDAITLHEDEDIAFGNLQWFFTPNTPRAHKFWQY